MLGAIIGFGDVLKWGVTISSNLQRFREENMRYLAQCMAFSKSLVSISSEDDGGDDDSVYYLSKTA